MDADDVADGAVVEALEKGAPLFAVAVAESAEHRDALRFRQLRGLEEVLHPGDVRGTGLLDEGVDPSINRGLEMGGTEAWRRREQDHVDSRIDHLFVGIDPVENASVEALGEFVFRDR